MPYNENPDLFGEELFIAPDDDLEQIDEVVNDTTGQFELAFGTDDTD